MKKFYKIFVSALCAAVMAVPVLFAACNMDGTDPNGGNGGNGGTNQTAGVDYVSNLKLDLSSETKKQEVTVRLYVDGDTTHFDPIRNSTVTPNTDLSIFDEVGYVKARYLAVNTPESTGKIEKWGKTASNFTHDALEKCKNGGSIIIESDDSAWNSDSTGTRFLLWIWYKPAGATDYRNLNVEILQNGFALASKTSNNRYGTVASAALDQAKANKLHLYSPASTVDVNWHDSEATELSIKELRCHVADYIQMPVRVTGIVAAVFSNTAYVQEYDEETQRYYGIAVYIGYEKGYINTVLSLGNEVNVVGKITDFQGTYQISGVEYNLLKPNATTNTTIISQNNDIVFSEASAADIINKQLALEFEVTDEDGEEALETVNIAYGDAVTSTAVRLQNLTVYKTTATESSTSSNGALSIRCNAEDGTQITIRTEVLYDANGNKVTKDAFPAGTVIKSVKGIVEKYTPDKENADEFYFQVKCYLLDYIEI